MAADALNLIELIDLPLGEGFTGRSVRFDEIRRGQDNLKSRPRSSVEENVNHAFPKFEFGAATDIQGCSNVLGHDAPPVLKSAERTNVPLIHVSGSFRHKVNDCASAVPLFGQRKDARDGTHALASAFSLARRTLPHSSSARPCPLARE